MNLATAQPAVSSPMTGGRRTIPFDYCFRFKLTGEPRKTHSQTVTVSIEAPFTAVSVGYGAVPTIEPIRFGLVPPQTVEPPRASINSLVNSLANVFPQLLRRSAVVTATASPVLAPGATAPGGGAGLPPTPAAAGGAAPGAGVLAAPSTLRQVAQQTFFSTTVASLAARLGEPINPAAGNTIGPRTASALRNGIKLNPELSESAVLAFENSSLDDASLAEAFQAVATPADQIQFLYALSDQGTNREFQSEPILSTAGLGASDGGRPFRYFAQPIEFTPLSAIRMQITEVSDFIGELHVCLQGYKTLGGAGSPTAIDRRRRRRVRS